MSRFLAVVLVIAVILVGAGWYLGWFNFSLNKEKIEQDTAKVTAEGKKVVDNIKPKSKDGQNQKTVKGTLNNVSKDTGMITVANQDGKPTAVRVTKQTTIERNGSHLTLNDLTPGQAVLVTFTTQEDEQIAESVKVESK